MIALLALTLFVQQTETMKVRPSSEADAVAEFEATCVAGLYDPVAMQRVATASARGYRFEGEGDAPGWRNWRSPLGTLHYLEMPAGTSAMAPRCNLTSFTRAAADRTVLEAALRAMAKRQAARGLSERTGELGRYWRWQNVAGQPMTAELVLDRRTPQQIVLMLKPQPEQR